VPIEKQCSRCQETLPAAQFWQSAHSPNGLAWRCKQCSSARIRAPLVAVPVASKKCGLCGLALPAAAFAPHSRWELKKGRLCNCHLLVSMLETHCLFESGLAAGVAVSRARSSARLNAALRSGSTANQNALRFNLFA